MSAHGEEHARTASALDDLFVDEVVGLDVPAGAAAKSAAGALRDRLRAAEAIVGKRRLAAAGAAARAEQSRPRAAPPDLARGAAALREVRSSDPAIDRKLTLAARNAGQGAEADQASFEEDLAELQAWEEREPGRRE